MILVLLFVTVVVNTLAAIGNIGGMTIEQISNLNSSTLTPVAASFSIWFAIYIWLAAALIYMLIKRGDYDRKPLNYVFAFSCAMNIGWIISWQFQKMVLSFVFMAFLFLSLIAMMFETNSDRFIVSGAFGLYAGWINIAMVANLFAVLKVTSTFWTIVALVLVAAQITIMLIETENITYVLGCVWGLLGIMLANSGKSLGILVVSGALAVALLSLIIFKKIENSYRRNLDNRRMV